MEKTRSIAVPASFLWGVATSAYQSEGGYNGAGQPQTNWAEAEKKKDVMPCGRAAEFWTRYREDFARCREMGLTAFRLGIEWSRIQPSENAFDEAALEHYAEILMACREHDLEPVVTLHHFVHPSWLGTDAWLKADTPERFERFVRKAVETVNGRMMERGFRPIRYYITINEPNMLVLNTYVGNQFPGRALPGFRSVTTACDHLLHAHVAAYNAVHDLYEAAGWSEPKVTLNNYCSDVYWSDKVMLDLLALRERGVPRESVRDHIVFKSHEFERAMREERIPLHRDFAYWMGTLAKALTNRFGWRWFTAKPLDRALDAIYASPRPRLLDYIGLDYYDPFAAHAFRLPVLWDHEFKNKSFRSWVMNTVTSKWWDWRVLPRGLHFFCRHYSEDFGDREVLIAENGMALRRRPDNEVSKRRDRMTRSQFLRLHVHEVQKIIRDGVPLIGYLHWSLFDNYEWGSFTPRFGLYSLDYAGELERHEEDPFGDRPSETYAELIAAARGASR